MPDKADSLIFLYTTQFRNAKTKTKNTFLYRYDSTVTVDGSGQPYSKKIYQYDAHNHRIKTVKYFFTSTGWMPVSKTTWTYNANDELIGTENLSYNSNAFKWYGSHYVLSYYPDGKIKKIYYYETILNNGNLLNQRKQEFFYSGLDYVYILKTKWFESDPWKEKQQVSYLFNSDSLLIKRVVRGNVSHLQIWRNSSQNLYAYNSHHLLASIHSMTWDTLNNQWNYEKKYIAEYDSMDNIVSGKVYLYHSNSAHWALINHTQYQYDSLGRLVLQQWNIWDFAQHQMEPEKKKIRSYFAQGKIKSVSEYDYNYMNQWEKSTRQDYLYYSFGDRFKTIFFLPKNNNWRPHSLYLNYYDSLISGTDIIGLSGHNKRIDSMEIYSLSSSGNPVSIDYSQYFYYSSLTNSIEDKEKKNVRVFPNPAFGQIFIQAGPDCQVNQFELYDMTGRRALRSRAGNSNSVNINGIAPGIYLYRLVLSDGEIQRGKIQIIR